MAKAYMSKILKMFGNFDMDEKIGFFSLSNYNTDIYKQ